MGLKGLATGVGSLPHKNAKEAVDLVMRCVPEIPFWPQLPQLGPQEGMVRQFSENLPQVQDGEKEIEKFYEKVIAQDTDFFAITEPNAAGLYEFYRRLKKADLSKVSCIKGQVTGPFTYAASLKGKDNADLIYDPILFQAYINGLGMKALWQIKLFKEFGKKIIIFIDEPFLSAFGSAYTPLNRNEVVRALSEMTDIISKEEVLCGAHCCGNTDWSIFTEISNLKLISFDAFDFLDRFVLYSEDLNKFLKRGGMICWGIVPTQLFTGEETVESSVRKLKTGLDSLTSKGIEEGLLLENLLVSPACGLGTFSVEKADKIFTLLGELSGTLKRLL